MSDMRKPEQGRPRGEEIRPEEPGAEEAPETLEEPESTDIEEPESTDIEEPESTDIEGPVRELAEKISELEDRWKRALADLDNYRKRALRELERERLGERERTSAEWLPVLDNLERALQHAEA